LRKPWTLPPCGQGGRRIQLSYVNRFETIWEYKEAFLSDAIDLVAYVGPTCPICNGLHCYERIEDYWRYAIDLFPEFKKEKVPVARFLCRTHRTTFSLLPIQLIPYFQYTVNSVIGMLFLSVSRWQTGQAFFYGIEASLDSESAVTAWLVCYWLMVVVTGLRRGHAELMALYDLSRIQTSKTAVPWQEFWDYFVAFGIAPGTLSRPLLHALLCRYSLRTRQFLFGTPSQHRVR